MVQTLILDCGADTIKAGLNDHERPQIFHNLLGKRKKSRRIHVSNEIENLSNLFDMKIIRPFEKGYLCSREHEFQIWEYLLKRQRTQNMQIVITEPVYNFEKIRKHVEEELFEKHKFRAVCRQVAPKMASYVHMPNFDRQSCLVLDSGFSFSHAVPIFDGCVLTQAIKRLNIGGKLLTNYLKEQISFKSVNLMDDFLLVDDIKKQCCKSTVNFDQSLKQLKENNKSVRYVLPGESNKRGRLKIPGEKLEPHQQSVRLKSEQYSLPEILHNPGIVNVRQSGLAELLLQSMKDLPEGLRPGLSQNILLCGGNFKFDSMKERVYQEVRKNTPAHIKVNVFMEHEPELTVWRGAREFSLSEDCHSCMVTRKQWEEYGTSITNRKFNIP